MTTATAKPPTSKAAKKGNALFDVKHAGLGATKVVPSDYRGQFPQAHAGLGMASLVRGSVSPGAIVLGGFAGIPVQQLASQVILQQTLGASPQVADGVTAGVGIVVHLLARTSFTLGLAFSMVAPFAASITQKGISWVANAVKQAPKPAMQGQNLQNQHRTNLTRDIRANAAA